jgi:hypothetical protein
MRSSAFLARFPPSLRGKALDLAGKFWEALRGAWLAVLAFFLVRVDPFGRARAPLFVSIGTGAGRRQISVCLVRGNTLPALRVAALFWRHYRHDWTGDRLAALALRHGVGGDLTVGGVLFAGGGDDEPPHAFALSFDLQTGTVALRHAKAGDGGRVCAHPPAPLALGAASLADVLRPLVGRRPCPAAPPSLLLGAFPPRPPAHKHA